MNADSGDNGVFSSPRIVLHVYAEKNNSKKTVVL